jgi:hypothetical protein
MIRMRDTYLISGNDKEFHKCANFCLHDRKLEKQTLLLLLAFVLMLKSFLFLAFLQLLASLQFLASVPALEFHPALVSCYFCHPSCADIFSRELTVASVLQLLPVSMLFYHNYLLPLPAFTLLLVSIRF